MKNPTVTFLMAGGAQIVVELLPALAPNTVNSFIDLAQSGCYDGWAIQRIVPGSWIDFSYSAFDFAKAKYLLGNEAPAQGGRPVRAGCMCMGGYGADEIAGGEIFFPLRDCPDLTGRYPIIGTVLKGMDELKRIEGVETYPVRLPSLPDVAVNTPVRPEVVRKASVETYGAVYPAPVKKAGAKLPATWL